MPSRIEVRSILADARAASKKNYFEGLGFKGKVKEVHVVDAYVIDAPLNKKELQQAGKLLTNPLLEEFSVNKPLMPIWFAPVKDVKRSRATSHGTGWVIEIGPRPGVTDNVGTTAREVLEDGLKKKFETGEKVYFSQVFFVSGKLSKEEAETLAESIHNPLIQRAVIKDKKEFARDKGMGKLMPKVKLAPPPEPLSVNLELPDEELTRIGKAGVADPRGFRRGPLALDLDSMKAIQVYFRAKRRAPTDIELESLAQTWSEHCKHTIFACPVDEVKEGFYRRYIKAATNKIRKAKGKKDFCVSVFTDNSGAIEFDEEYLVTHKVETHNSPSALDPFGGAITGIVGVNRDTMGFGLGAKPTINTYGFCFADPRDKSEFYRDQARMQKLLPARRIMEGVIAGVNAGGNCSGIPTPQGFVWFDPRFRGKPLVFVGTVGIIPRKSPAGSRGPARKLYEKKANPGDLIVMAGNRVGQDGIHGATFSSVALDAGSPATAVQIGDPITQKKLSDVLVKEARDMELYSSITDNGAGGISCSVAEMAKEAGGCEVELDKVPLKYPGLEPWQIWISESQERMTLAVPPKKWKAFSELLARRGVEATVIGTFTDSGRCVVRYGGEKIMDMEMEFLHEGWVRKELHSRSRAVQFGEPMQTKAKDLSAALLALLARPNLASFEFISKQYDHEVQAGSVTKPLAGKGRVNVEATVTRPRLDSPQGVVLSQGLYPTYSEINAYNMAASAIDTAIRAAVVAGADPERIALLDNFCWCSSYDPERLAQLKEALRACYDTAVAFEAPFISGKDSMFNDFKGFDAKGNSVAISIPPTLLISAIGIAKEATNVPSIDFKFAGDLVYVLGETHEELGGSEYAMWQSEAHKKVLWGNKVPKVNAATNKKLYAAFANAAEQGLIASAISVGRGGLGIAIMKSAMAGNLGAELDLAIIPGEVRSEYAALFSESQGRILVSVNPKQQKEFEHTLKGNAFACLGKVVEKEIRLRSGNKKISPIKVTTALKAYRSTFVGY
ncbi:MAG: phosphoribosylformylglycinamidine synthase [Candidatus Liptonbacteria bacterium]|nr:phosphoribosylformylglycinamidine synthase [Candidatus Liptonbacteria bacterium]